MELIGIVQEVKETEVLGKNGFKKRSLIIQTKEEYPQDISVDFVQAKVDLLDSIKQDDTVSIMINIRGNKWTNPKGKIKYFTSIQGWKINKTYVGEKTTEPEVKSTEQNPSREAVDLPF